MGAEFIGCMDDKLTTLSLIITKLHATTKLQLVCTKQTVRIWLIGVIFEPLEKCRFHKQYMGKSINAVTKG